MNNNPDWRSEMEQAKKELGSLPLLAAYWLGATVLLFLAAMVMGQGVPGVFNIIIIILAAVPIALGAGWLTARKKKDA